MHKFVVVLILLLLAGCANVSRFEKGAFTAFGGKVENASEPLYYLVRMDLSKPPSAETPIFSLKFSAESPAIPWDRLSETDVSSHLPRFIPPQVWPDILKKRAAERNAYEGLGYYLSFRDERLEYVGLCSHCGGELPDPAPSIGTADGEVFLRLPLTQKELVRIVGRPTRVYKVSEVRY